MPSPDKKKKEENITPEHYKNRFKNLTNILLNETSDTFIFFLKQKIMPKIQFKMRHNPSCIFF